MKKTIVLCMVLVCCLIGGGCGFESEAKSASGTVDVPDFALENMRNELVRLSSFKDEKPVLLIFWATWCPHCLKEIRNLIAYRNEIPESDLEIMAVNIEESEAKIGSYSKKYGINYTVVMDRDGRVSADYDVRGVPTIVLVGKDGKGVVADHGLSRSIKNAVGEIIR